MLYRLQSFSFLRWQHFKKSRQHLTSPPLYKMDQPGTSDGKKTFFFEKKEQEPLTWYPEGHPMHDIKRLDQELFGHLYEDLKGDIIPLSKRRKILRRLERKRERILNVNKQLPIADNTNTAAPREGSLWDVREKHQKTFQNMKERSSIIGPKQQTIYTIKDNKIVRLEPIKVKNDMSNVTERRFQAVDIVVPVNPAEGRLLEGTKMSVDDIRSIDRFKDYQPGIPSKVLYVKNISPSVTLEQVSQLLNQFHLENGGKVDIRLMSGKMRGQAFLSFKCEELAVRALEELNGTIVGGKPLIAHFGRNTNRIQPDNT